ncbi:MAG: penicillin-binding protein 2, partial [Planctomycetes bacterium]|nr:penicillin-binding protein 2 [Planctomycetota bacterium]
MSEKTQRLGLDETIDVRSPFELGRYRIHDFDDHGTELPAALVFAESSNIGTARIALRSGPENQRAFLERTGLLTPLTTEIPEIAAPLLPRRWGEVETATVSYGHGISVNPLSFAAAAAALVNGGTKIRPTFLKSDAAQHGERVVSLRTSRTMRHLLRLAVTNGTGSKADVPGYDVGGKTGTAEKPAGRGYSRNRRIASFVGVFPASDPEFLVFILFDEPKGTRASYGFATGGFNPAPE